MSKKHPVNLLEEMTRSGPLVLKRSGARSVTFDTEDGRAKTKDAKILAEEKSMEEKVKKYLAMKKGQIVSAKSVAKDLGIAWQPAANEIVKFWRRGYLESRREKKRMYYLVGEI